MTHSDEMLLQLVSMMNLYPKKSKAKESLTKGWIVLFVRRSIVDVVK